MPAGYAVRTFFEIGQPVQLAEHLHVGGLVPRGTVIGFAEGEIDKGDVIVRWESGQEVALAPWSLTAATS